MRPQEDAASIWAKHLINDTNILPNLKFIAQSGLYQTQVQNNTNKLFSDRTE